MLFHAVPLRESSKPGLPIALKNLTTVSDGEASYAVEGLARIGSENFNASLATFAVRCAF